MITLPSTRTFIAHARRHVTYHWGKSDPHYWIPDKNLPVNLFTLEELLRSLNHVICEQ